MKIICVGRNYAAHAIELNNPVPVEPLIFMKPDTACLLDNWSLYYPDFTKDLHYEVELIVKICKMGKFVKPKFAKDYYNEISVGIDFTARDIQQQCKEKGLPWEIAKSWNNSAAIGTFIPYQEALNPAGNIDFSLTKNTTLVQEGNSYQMINNIDNLICYISKFFMLKRGDIIFTGTPQGVGPVQVGDQLEGFIGNQSLLKCAIK